MLEELAGLGETEKKEVYLARLAHLVGTELQPHAQPPPGLKLELNTWELLESMHHHEREAYDEHIDANVEFESAQSACALGRACRAPRQRVLADKTGLA